MPTPSAFAHHILPLLGIAMFASCARQPDAVPCPAEAQVALHAGPTLRYLEQGPADGEPLVLLHGYSDSSFSFSRLLPLLPPELRVLVLDQRGHGGSSKDQPSHTIADLAADVVAFLDAQAVPRATIVGHSLGSMVAQRVAIDQPSRVRRLVLIGATPRGSNPTTEALLADVRRLTDPIDPGFVREFQRSTLHAAVPEEFFARACSDSLRVPARIWRELLEDFVRQDTTVALGRVQAPTLVLWGDKDAIFPRADQDTLARLLSGATVRVLADVGHSPQWEDPEAVAAELLAFLRAPDAAR